MIDYYEHIRFKETYDTVKSVMLENCPEKEFSDGWRNLLEQIQSRFYPDEAIKPWTELHPGKDELCDPETGVCYLIYDGINKGGITPRYNQDGSLMVKT